ncbi:MAG: hypothetical protein DRH50_14925 [Deltaproteobacteria bacterium]|nr:MAG: hypothetical protein DRH50_14925 [Deltaproteobacteria bacterium]
MQPGTWGILSIALGAIIYKISPNPANDEVMHSIAYASYRNKFFRYLIYLSGVLPPLLWVVGIILGFLSSWKMGLLYLLVSIILWIILSPTIRSSR